jgi:sugar lactone lactonase YvrE
MLVVALSGSAIPAMAQEPAPDRIELPDGWQPEGITSNGAQVVYVGSLADGAVWRGNTRTGEGERFVEAGEGTAAAGLDWEAAERRLWIAGGPSGQIRVADGRTGSILRSYAFEEAGFLNDVTVTTAGAFATDSNNPQLAFVPIGRNGALLPEAQATLIPLSGDIEYADGFNANGIVSTGGWLILVQSNTGRLFRVDPASGTTFAIDTGDADLSGGDGLELLEDRLYVVRGGGTRIAVLELSPLLDRATLIAELTSDDFDVPTTVAVADDQLWAVNARFGTDPTPETAYWITRLPLRP